jgi:hypothetical protein
MYKSDIDGDRYGGMCCKALSNSGSHIARVSSRFLYDYRYGIDGDVPANFYLNRNSDIGGRPV